MKNKSFFVFSFIQLRCKAEFAGRGAQGGSVQQPARQKEHLPYAAVVDKIRKTKKLLLLHKFSLLQEYEITKKFLPVSFDGTSAFYQTAFGCVLSQNQASEH